MCHILKCKYKCKYKYKCKHKYKYVKFTSDQLLRDSFLHPPKYGTLPAEKTNKLTSLQKTFSIVKASTTKIFPTCKTTYSQHSLRRLLCGLTIKYLYSRFIFVYIYLTYIWGSSDHQILQPMSLKGHIKCHIYWGPVKCHVYCHIDISCEEHQLSNWMSHQMFFTKFI